MANSGRSDEEAATDLLQDLNAHFDMTRDATIGGGDKMRWNPKMLDLIAFHLRKFAAKTEEGKG